MTRLPIRPWQAVLEKHPAVLRALIAAALAAHLVGTAGGTLPPLTWAMLATGALALVMPDRRIGQALWTVLALAFAARLIPDYFRAANHEFVLAYFALLMALLWRAEPFWPHAERFCLFMLALLMGLALIQKVSSPFYMDGDLLGQFLLQRDIYGMLTPLLIPGIGEADIAATALRDRVLADYALSAGSVTPLPPLPEGLAATALAMTYSSIAFQGGLEVALLFRRRLGVVLHLVIVFFVITVYAMRHENVFLSLNCIMGFALTDDRSRGMRVIYVGVIGWLLVTYLLGYRPALLI
ncbi:hypothetical protein LNKW23_44860 [Paralimibaculum aggregatum]|uniref:Uncharacterized protein n=1 Tax=Paralimibaculum aggregatum TaxID=3036245 RepID=A0ABQ6LT44_9RHOB|nr:hypothetical protein [Limibaculum sp. NKW23]GMG85268.1 hypothetical protein LNKW23_44860 [Limibaculum sp. NKW23]